MGSFKVLKIERHRLVTDGKGVTTLVALLGCPLKCEYCINKNILAKTKYLDMAPEALLDKVMIDYCYFVSTGGGVTFGGGESLVHANQIIEFMNIMPEAMQVNLETSMNMRLSQDVFDRLLEGVQEFIIDIKAVSNELYKAYTGIENQLVFDNLKYIVDKGYADKCRIKIPVIPEYKERTVALEEAEYIRNMGFKKVQVFDYIIKG